MGSAVIKLLEDPVVPVLLCQVFLLISKLMEEAWSIEIEEQAARRSRIKIQLVNTTRIIRPPSKQCGEEFAIRAKDERERFERFVR